MNNQMFKEIQLTNNSYEMHGLVVKVVNALQNLKKTNSIALFELIELCCDPQHILFSKEVESTLTDLGLIKNSSVPSSIQNIVLSSVVGTGIDIELTNPIKRSETTNSNKMEPKILNIYNGTQHEITIYSKEDTYEIQGGRKLILKPDAVPVQVVAPGKNLNCVMRNKQLAFNFMNSNLPLVGGVEFVSHDELPNADLIIVSNLFRSAVKELSNDYSRLATVFGTVYRSEEDLRPCGVLGLAVG